MKPESGLVDGGWVWDDDCGICGCGLYGSNDGCSWHYIKERIKRIRTAVWHLLEDSLINILPTAAGCSWIREPSSVCGGWTGWPWFGGWGISNESPCIHPHCAISSCSDTRRSSSCCCIICLCSSACFFKSWSCRITGWPTTTPSGSEIQEMNKLLFFTSVHCMHLRNTTYLALNLEFLEAVQLSEFAQYLQWQT